MQRLVCLFLFLSLMAFSYGQDSTALKRPPYKLKVYVDEKTVYEEDLKETPYVLQENTVQLYPGETVYVEIEEEKGIVKKVHAVKENTNPEKTVVISFMQSEKNKVHEMMILKVTNPFPRDLIYNAVIFPLRQKKWISTDVNPVQSKLASFETWPDVITSIGLGHWTFQDK